MQSFLPVTYLTVIRTPNRSVTIFFYVASLEALMTGDGRGRGERCVKVNLGDSRKDVGKFEGGYVEDR